MPPATRRLSTHSISSSDGASAPIDLTSSPEPSLATSQACRKRTLGQANDQENGPSAESSQARPKRPRQIDTDQILSQGREENEQLSQLSGISQQPQPSGPSWRLPDQERDTDHEGMARNEVIDLDDVEEVDLTSHSVGDLGTALQKQRADQIAAQKPEDEQNKPLRFSNITCVICMDTPTDLTATSCGHVFCHTCLMEALIAGENRGGPGEAKRSQCPVCRKNISRKKASDIIPLLLKKGLSTQPRRKGDAAVI